MAEDSDQVTLSDGVIEFASGTFVNWRIAISDVAIVGEYTNQNGPYMEDHFWVFVTHNASIHYVCMGAEGLQSVRSAVERALGAELAFKLFHSTDLASRIMWPPLLAEQPLFAFRRLPCSKWHRVFNFLQPDCVTAELTDEAAAFISQ